MKLVLTGLLLMGGMATLKAQQQPVISYSHIWSYLITNATPTGWNASNYPAANDWWIGQSVFAFPANEDMPTVFAGVATLLDTNFNGNIVTSFYFRTTFVLTNVLTSNLVMNATAIVDDGAVVYVNGREVQRIRMPNGTITHNTFANAGGEVAARLDTFRIASTNFVRGTNVVAVEVHQDAAASSDVVFGFQLVPGFIDPVTITTQPYPSSREIETGQRATFAVGALGSDVRYQWYTNNVPVPGAVFRSYTTPPMNTTTTGIVYSVIASNEVNNIRSTNVFLTVIQDRSGPAITNLTLEGTAGVTNRVRLDLSEASLLSSVYPAITNPANYSIAVMVGTNVTTNMLTITNVAAPTVGSIRLTTAERMNSATNYVVCAYNLPDSKSNFAAAVCLAFDTVSNSTIFAMGSTWQFQNTTRDLSLDNWEAPVYPDTEANGWGSGIGGFVFDFDGWAGCVDRVTSTARGARTTYFRTKFTVSTGALGPVNTNPTIRITHGTDDGAVFYLNGQDIYRYNMPAAPAVVNYATVATAAVGNANVCQTVAFEVPRGLFRLGANANTMAVEVHQQEADLDEGNSDVAFDMSLSFEYQIVPVLPVTNSRLTIAHGATPGTVLVTWTGAPTFRLYESPSLGATAVWTQRPANVGNNGYQTTTTPGQQRFYRTSNQ